jgi:hypothetical protein
MKRNNPTTSNEAWKSVKDTDMLSEHHSRILAALDELKSANYERIAMHCNMEGNQISRRLAELERMIPPLIEKTGETLATKSGRKANLYRLVPPPKKTINASDFIQSSLWGS